GENISRDFVVPTVATCIDVVVHCERDRQGRRRVREILTVGSRVEGGVIETSALFQRDAEGDLRLNEGANLEFEALARRGVDVHELVGLR
ncbi:MAG TPA: pilus assembly protein CpaF, partial [Micrococcus luteus]|nr:pilus assembly protein CpaF [Micrococcus luteus]